MSEWTAERLKSFRTKYRLSQAKLAEMVGVTENYIYLLEKEVKTPSRTLQLLLDFIERDYEARK